MIHSKNINVHRVSKYDLVAVSKTILINYYSYGLHMHTFWTFALDMGSTDEIGVSEVVDGVSVLEGESVLVDKSIALILFGALRLGTSEKVDPVTE